MTDSTHRTEEKVPVNLLSKELECLFALGAVMDDWDIDWPDTVRDILRILPKGFREPELLGGRLTVAKEVFHSPGFKETEWILRAPFTVPKSTGMLEVAYKKA